MNIDLRERRVMRMLAAMRGNALAIESYDERLGKELEGSNFPLSVHEFRTLGRVLEEKGLVASVLERLDGLLIALTTEGRKLMEIDGAVFDPAAVERTRSRFKEGACTAAM